MRLKTKDLRHIHETLIKIFFGIKFFNKFFYLKARNLSTYTTMNVGLFASDDVMIFNKVVAHEPMTNFRQVEPLKITKNELNRKLCIRSDKYQTF